MTSHLTSLSTPEIVNELVCKMYEPPLSRLRARIATLPEPLRVLMLVSDFDTEVLVNGIAGFLENPTGEHLHATIEAFEAIAARSTAATLRAIEATMREHGVTHGMLRAPLTSVEEFSVVSSSELHTPKTLAMLEAATTLASGLYLYQPSPSEAVFDLLCLYLESRRAELLEATSAA
jgi:Domain of unknown function (DUF4375)